MKKDLDIIKKKYGEKMAHLCRELFPTLLETEGLLSNIMLSKFNPDHFLYDAIIEHSKKDDFKNYIYSFVDAEQRYKIHTDRTPKDLMSEAGYILYECKTEEDIMAFKGYYRSNEALCTFKGERLYTNYVFFAVKKNVDEIKREDFPKPERQDEYGTSVISIQFTRGKTNTLSIKNRYNHTVNSPDATFSNNLDNIIPGLTDSFTRAYNFNIIENNFSFDLPGYVLANDERWYRYNLEIDNIYYCPDNIIINEQREVERLDRSKYLLIDYFIIDLKKDNRSVLIHDFRTVDSFPDYFNEKGIKSIEIVNIDDGKEIKITLNNDEEVIIRVDKFNQITYLKNDNITEISDNFLYCNQNITTIDLREVKKIGNSFLINNKDLISIELPNVQIIGDSFLFTNSILNTVRLPEVISIGNHFLVYNTKILTIELPNVKGIGSSFITSNSILESLDLPIVESIGPNFLVYNKALLTLNLPNVKEIGKFCLFWNAALKIIELPELVTIGDDCSIRISKYLHNREQNNNSLK